MNQCFHIEAEPERAATIAAVSELLTKLRIDHAFVGEVAIGAWLGRKVSEGAIDVLAAVSPEGSKQIPMMASHRGFEVDRDAVEAAEELDLIPLTHVAGEARVRVHILMASNALYGTMIRDAIGAPATGGLAVRVLTAEDLALLMTMSDDEKSLQERKALLFRTAGEFDYDRFNERMFAIGLPDRVLKR